MPNRESDKIRAIYVRDGLVRIFKTCVGSGAVFPAPIAMDISTGDYFPVSLNIADNNENEKLRFVSAADRLLGVFKDWDKDAEHTLLQEGTVAPNTIVTLATKSGFNEYAIGIARKALGNEVIDAVMCDITRGTYYSEAFKP